MYLEDLKDKAVLITGASTGIGATVARAMGRYGARVGVHYRSNRTKAEAVASDIRSLGGKAATFTGDLSRSSHVEALIAEFVAHFGRIDVLINNAGDLVARRPLLQLSDADYDGVLDLNARSVVIGCQAAIRQFLKQGDGGVIVNTGSIAARHGGRAGSLLYAGAKAFVHNFTRGVAKEYARNGIRVNTVAPGVIATPYHDRHSSPLHMQEMARNVPMGRVGTPEDCVGAYLFLSSNAMSGYLTGQTIDVNGGQFMT